jgi:hypothetical protein
MVLQRGSSSCRARGCLDWDGAATNRCWQSTKHFARDRQAYCSIAGEFGVATVAVAGKPVGDQVVTAAGRVVVGAGEGAGQAGPSTRAAAGIGIATGSQRVSGPPRRIAAEGSDGWMRGVGDIGQSRCPAVCCTGPKGCRQVPGMTRGCSGRRYGACRRGRVSATREGAILRRNSWSRRRL